jgi:hypothetical protein
VGQAAPACNDLVPPNHFIAGRADPPQALANRTGHSIPVLNLTYVVVGRRGSGGEGVGWQKRLHAGAA